jgi:hypothetical protein
MENQKPEENKDTRNESIAILVALRDKFYDKFTDEISQNLIIEKSNELKSIYPNFRDYEAYHILISSTPRTKLLKFDFPGDYSVEKFFSDKISE